MSSLLEAKKKAKEQHKFIFVDFSAVWCGPCQMMIKNVFPDEEVKKALEKDFVSVGLLGAQYLFR